MVMRSSKRVIFFQDLFFFVSAAILTFFFALTVTGGELRFYLFLGLGIGFTAYITIGRVVMAFAETAVAGGSGRLALVWRLVFAPFRLLGRLLRRPLGFLQKLCGAALEKVCLFLKKGLKRAVHLVYNQKKRPEEE